MKITFQQKELLIDKIEDIERIAESDDVNDLLFPLDDLITKIGFDENYELNKEGLKLQKLYDEILEQNSD